MTLRTVPRWLPHCLAPLLVVLALLTTTTQARAQDPEWVPPPDRGHGWNRATNIMALSSAALQVLMPRVFYSDPEVTVGWKARWHVSAFAPTMTMFALTLINDQYIQDEFEAYPPGCGDENAQYYYCKQYGLFSSPALLSFGMLGQGTGVFLVDTLKWSNGKFNVGGFIGNVGVPLVLSVMTAIGRTAGHWETGGQVWTSAGIGLGAGFGMGLLYAIAQRPECGYEGGLICW